METSQKTNEELAKELEDVKSLLESLRPEPKPKSEFVAKVGESLQRSVINVVDDLPTTATGFFVAGSIIVSQWPNVDFQTMMEAVGFGSLGGMSTTKGRTPKAPDHQEFG